MSRESPGASKTHSLKSTSSLTRWLRRAAWGEHFLLAYNTTDEFLQVLVTYLEAGLSQNQACLWVVSALPLEEAKKALCKKVGGLSPYLRKKQLLILDHLDWYLAGGSFDEETILRDLLKKEEEALARGFEGLRFAIDAAWAEKRDWPPLFQYEARLSKALAGRKMVALCAYPAQRLSLGELVDITNTHDLLIAREGRAFRLTRPISAGPGKLSRVELQRVHKQAKEQFNSYKSMVKSARNAIFFKDLQSRYILANNKTFAVFGLSREEVIGKNDLEIMPDKKEARKNIEDDQIVFKTGKPREIAKHMTGADGKEYWFEAIKVPQFDNDGKVIGLVGITKDITQRKRAEEGLRTSEAKYRTLYETITDGIGGGPMDGRIGECNQALADMLGYTREELKNLTYQQLTPKRWHQMEARMVEEQILKRGYSDEYEKEYIRKDGTVFPISAKVWLVRDKDGKPQGMWGIVRDITQRKRAEEALSQSEEKYRTLSQNIPGMVFRGKPDWSTEIISNSESISGYTAEAFNSGKLNWLDITHPDDKERVLKEALTLEENPKSMVQEYRIITKEGSIRWVEEHKTSLFKNGVFQGVDGIAFDFTKRRRAEQALRLVEVKYQALFESSPEGILIADLRNKQFKYANPAMCKMLGYSQEDFRTMGKRDIKPQESMEYVLPEVYGRARGEKPPAENIPFVRKDGKTIYVDINMANALIDDKECVIAFFRDVTEREKGRERLEKRSQEVKLLDTVVTSISESRNLEEAAARTLKTLCKRLKVPMARLYVLDEGQEVLRFVTHYGTKKKIPPGIDEIKLGRLPVGRAAEKKALEVWAFSKSISIQQDGRGRESKARFAAALPLISREKVLGVIYFWGWDKRTFTSDELRLLKTIGAPVAMAIEKAHLFKEATLQRDRSAALHEISQTITKTLNLKEVAKRSLKAVLKVVQLELGSVHVFDEDQSVLRLITYVGFPEEGARKHKEIKAGSHHFVWRAAAEKKISMPDSSRKTHPVKRSKSVPKLTCSGRPIALPLISKGKVRGVMVVGAPDRQNYTPDELDFLQAVASQVARAIENAHLYQKAEQSVEELRALSTRITKLQEEERARIVNYLHTNLAQTLATAKMNLDLLSQQPNKNPAQLRKSLSSVILTIDEAIKETRGLMFDIRTPMLDDLGLLAAVRWYTKAFFERTGVKVKIEGNHSLKDLSENRRIIYFRIIQELLTNVAKHAKVAGAKLTLERRKEMDLIVVRDSGVGFDPKSLRLSHSAVTGLGLVAIREMVSHNKGHLDIHSAPAKGTTVTVSIPTKEPASIG